MLKYLEGVRLPIAYQSSHVGVGRPLELVIGMATLKAKLTSRVLDGRYHMGGRVGQWHLCIVVRQCKGKVVKLRLPIATM